MASLPRETTLHWGEATADGVRALRDCGYTMLLSDFIRWPDGRPRLSYHFDRSRWQQLWRNGALFDDETGGLFVPCDVVLNSFTPAEIVAELDRLADEWPGRRFRDVIVHEQYFYDDYINYLPDFRERVLAGVRWCVDHGFEPGFIEDYAATINE